jgi:hypothetical protein
MMTKLEEPQFMRTRSPIAVLGIDPGITTGWAILRLSDRKLLFSGESDEEDVGQQLDYAVRHAHGDGYRIEVVVERMPPGRPGPLAQRLEVVRRSILRVVDETYALKVSWVRPSDWKTSRVAKENRGLRRMSRHSRDAFLMALFFYEGRTW